MELERYRIIQDLKPSQALWQAVAAREEGEDKKRLFFSRGRCGVIMAVGAYQGHSRKMLNGVRLSLVMHPYYTRRDLMDLPLYVYHGTRRGAAEKIIRSGLWPGGDGVDRAHIHLVKDISKNQDQADVSMNTVDSSSVHRVDLTTSESEEEKEVDDDPKTPIARSFCAVSCGSRVKAGHRGSADTASTPCSRRIGHRIRSHR